jgi:hypothetical protein
MESTMAGSLFASLAVLSVALPAAADAGLKAVALAAADAARKGLKSGTGEGVYERSDGPGGPPIRYAARVSHLGPKYHVELIHLGPCPPGRPSKLVLIYDGQTLAVREVNAVIRPHGEEARLHLAVGDRTRSVLGLTFPFNPTCLQAAVLDLSEAGRTAPNKVFGLGDTVFGAGPDDIFASVRFPPDRALQIGARFSKAAGYNVGEFSVARTDTGYRQEAVARWGRSAGAWYVREVETTYARPGLGREYQRLTYTTFTANADIAPALFQLPALGLVRGARLLYINVQSEVADAYTNDPPARAGGRGDTLLDDLRRLPASWSRRPVAPAPREVRPSPG